MTFAEKIEKVAARAGLKVSSASDAYVKCSFSLDDDRIQTVHLYPVGKLGDLHIVKISTPVVDITDYDLTIADAQTLLVENGQMKLGSFCIEYIQGHKVLSLQHNMVLDTLDPQEFAVVAGILAKTGDQWEQRFGIGDKY